MSRGSAVGATLAVTCLIGSQSPAALGGVQAPKERSIPIVVHTSNGFDWGDAAIGAAAGLGAAFVGAGAITLARNR